MEVGAGTFLLLKILKDNIPLTFLDDSGITEDTFYSESDLDIYQYIKDHNNEYGKIPSLPVVYSKFAHLRSIVLPNESGDFFINRFKDRTIREALRQKMSSLSDGTASGKKTDFILKEIEELQSFIIQLDNANSKNIDQLYTLSEAFREALNKAIKRRKATDVTSGASFGFDFLDKVTDGGQNGDLISISARPGAGKTHILINSANASYDAEKTVMIATFEMPAEQLARRLIERRTNIPSKYLKFGKFTFLAERTINDHIIELQAKEATGHKLIIYQGQLLSTTSVIKEKLDLIKPDVFMVDGAYNMKVGRGNKSKWEHVSEGAEFLKDTALVRQIPVFATYQLNREGKGKKGSGDNIMYSDSVIQLASIAITVLNPDDTKTDTPSSWGGSLKRILRIDKGRDGEFAIVEVELSFGRKPFRVTRVIQGDLSHIGYGFGPGDGADPLDASDDFSMA